jgi:hypothetical protein
MDLQSKIPEKQSYPLIRIYNPDVTAKLQLNNPGIKWTYCLIMNLIANPEQRR